MFEGWDDIDINDPNSWPTSFKIFGAFVVACGIIAATYYYVVKDQRQVFESSVRKEAELKSDFLEKKALAINLEAYKAQKIEAENMFSVLKEQLPSETEIPDLLVDVTQLGLSRGLIFDQFEPRDEIEQEFYKEKPVHIVVYGSYHQLANFVSDVAALPRIVNVNDFEITRTSNARNDSTKNNNLNMNAVIKTYYYQEEK